MRLAKQTVSLLRRNPILWVPQLVVAVVNLLLNTATVGVAHRVAHAIRAGRVPLLVEHYTLRTPDALIPSDGATVPILYSSRFIQYFLILAAVVAVAALVRRQAPAGIRRDLIHRRSAILNAALLITGLALLELTSDVFLAAAFSYIPSLRPAPAWLLIVLQAAAFVVIVIAFFWVAVPWVLRLAAADLRMPLTSRQKNAARWIAFLARAAWDLFEYLWGRVEGHFLPPRVDPGPFWRAPITLGSPVFLWILLTIVSVAAAVIAERHRAQV
jgi:hypothetical protein